MSSSSETADRIAKAPFLVQLFHRNGSFHHPEEFTLPTLPAHVRLFTWPTCTLHDLALELAASKPCPLPYPSIGTRLVFQLVCPDLRGVSAISNAPPRYAVKDLGSVVIGPAKSSTNNVDDIDLEAITESTHSGSKTLENARFVVGDFVSCAILPPLADGSVAPVSAIRRESLGSLRDSRGYRDGLVGRDTEFNPNDRRGKMGSRRDDGGGGISTGHWRRREQPSDVSPGGPRGGPRGRYRW